MTWALLKEIIVELTGLSKDGLHVYLGLIIFIFFAVLSQLASSILPWLAVLLLELGNEAMDLIFWYQSSELKTANWNDSMWDLGVTMLLPTILVLAAKGLRLSLSSLAKAVLQTREVSPALRMGPT